MSHVQLIFFMSYIQLIKQGPVFFFLYMDLVKINCSVLPAVYRYNVNTVDQIRLKFYQTIAIDFYFT